ncbi:uncharacterized protein [Nicotiana sylvestris]|uniref:uncharacterized protein n=1 Tax=Nicotiana sylvestris TaxID=4096 RepID=UPI00388C7531
MEGEKKLIKVLPMKSVMRFGGTGKLSPRFIGPLDILERIRKAAYRLELPPSLLGAHAVFHVSIIQKYHEDRSHVLDFITGHIDEDLTYKEEPVAILDRQVQKLRSNDISSVKVLWRGLPMDEATWESESGKNWVSTATPLYPGKMKEFSGIKAYVFQDPSVEYADGGLFKNGCNIQIGMNG